MEKLSSFWDFVKLTPARLLMLWFLDEYLPTIRVNSRCEGNVGLTLRRVKYHCGAYGRVYGEGGYDVWEYTYYVRNIFGYEMVYSMGRIVLDTHKRVMIEQTTIEGIHRRFQDIVSLFFVDAVIYTDLPALKSISLDVMKTYDLLIHNIHSLD